MTVAGVAAALLLLAGLVITTAAWSWWQWRRIGRTLASLEEQMRAEQERRHAAPGIRLVFEYNRQRQLARLHVTNSGPVAAFRAPLTVHGALAAPLERPVFARWTHTDRPSAVLDPGQTGVLSLARLELAFPFACWQLQLTDASATPLDVSAAHSSVIGGNATADPRPLLLEVTVVSDDSGRGARSGLVALRPFSAEWVTWSSVSPASRPAISAR